MILAGDYLVYSPEHTRSVALILNLKTGHVSPQVHVFDDKFDYGKEMPILSPCGKTSWTSQMLPVART